MTYDNCLCRIYQLFNFNLSKSYYEQGETLILIILIVIKTFLISMIEFKVLIQSNMKWFPASAGVCDEYINLTADAKLQLEDWKIQSDPAERDVR